MWTHVQEYRDAIQQETAKKKWRSNRKRWVDWIDNGLNSGCQLNPVHTKCNRTTKDHAIYIYYIRYCQSLEPVKPFNGEKTAGGYPQHRRGYQWNILKHSMVLGYWEHADTAPDRAEVQVMFKVTAQVVHYLQIQGFMRAVNDPKICVSPWRMMVFRHTILDRPTTLLFGDWMLDCRCYPVFWAPSVKVHVQQKVMDLSLIHQKKHCGLVASILYHFLVTSGGLLWKALTFS